jgi:hypothetical protein
MDLSSLASLGKIAGLGGLAIGLVALLGMATLSRARSTVGPRYESLHSTASQCVLIRPIRC